MKTRKPAGNKSGKRRVLIIDDHPVLREGLALVINQQHDLAVCGEAADARQAFGAIAKLKPDVALVDISLETSSGLELIKDAHAQFPKLIMLACSMHDEALYAERALRAGARGYIMKREPTGELLAAIRHVLTGELYTSRKMAGRMMRQFISEPAAAGPRPATELLSDRELEVFQLLGKGQGTHEIAQLLHLSPKTVSCYRQNIKTKLNLKSANELVHHAIHWATLEKAD